MSVMVLNNNAVTELVAAAYSQMIGGTDHTAPDAALDLEGLIDYGVTEGLLESKEQYTKALANVVYDYLYTTAAVFNPTESEPFYVRADEWGGILAAISIDTPDTIIENRAWQTFVSGVTSVGTSVVYLPVIEQKLFGASFSWAVPISISKQQWATAVKDAAGMSALVNAVYIAARNAITEHRLAMDRTNRNNYIATLIAYSADESATGVHVVDVNALYNAYIGNTGDNATNMTRKEFLNSPEAMIFAAKTLDEYKGYIEEPSVLFNVDGKDRFVPRGETVIQILDAFEKQLEYAIKSDVFHKNVIELPNHRSVTAWQGLGEGLTFEELSTINVNTADDNAVNVSGVIAFMAHPMAVMHTIVHEETVTEYYKFTGITHTEYQFVDRYANNLGMPAIVFVINDYTPVEDAGGDGGNDGGE